MKDIPYGRQDVTREDIDAVNRVLRSDWLTQGPAVPQFETKVADYCGARFAVAMNSATSALHAACAALDVREGDIVWTSANTFVASANCALYCGATIGLIDINIEDGNIDPIDLEERLEKAARIGRLPKVVIPIHFAGEPCDLRRIHSLSKKFGFRIIEDASHAIGARHEDQAVGSCRYSDITIFSFHPVKIITSGEGGMATTNDNALAEKMSRFRSHGITRDHQQMYTKSDEPWYYEQIELGFNYRMSDIHAVLGMSQMNRLEHYISARHELAARYDESLGELPITKPLKNQENRTSLHLYIIRLKLDQIKKSRRDVVKELLISGIGVNVHYIPLYRHSFYQRMGFCRANFPATEKRYQESVTLPLFAKLSQESQQRVVTALREVLTE